MKKILCIALAVALICCLAVGCTPKDEKGEVYYLNFKPEFDKALQALAAKYTEQTGVKVTVLTAASGDYNSTLTAKIKDVTIFNIGNPAALADWDDYALDLADSAIAKELTTNDFNLYNDQNELKAIGNCYESFGIIVNKTLLKQAGYEITDITDFASLKRIAEDITARTSELGFSAFTSAGLDGSSSWRFSGHLATLPLHYQGVDTTVATITNEYMDLYKNVWDLYINNSTTKASELSSKTGDESRAEFTSGKAVFYQNGTWEYAELTKAGMTDDQLAMIPIYCGATDDAKSALCSGTENHWAINSKASEADQKASIDFLVWLVSDEEAAATYVEQLGAVPFKNCPASTNKFVADGDEMLKAGKTSISWAFNYTPNVDAWRATVVTALTAYSSDTSDANWAKVVEAFVDGWAYEYNVVNGK